MGKKDIRDIINDDPSTDLHIHTNHSDGEQTPEEVVKWAKEKGLTLMSVTDHDGVGGLKDAAAAAEKAGIGFVTGVEFSTDMQFEGCKDRSGKIEMHMLGYGFDPDNEDVLKKCAQMIENRGKRNEKLLEAIIEARYDISKGDIPPAEDGFVGKPQIAELLIEKGYFKSQGEVFDVLFDGKFKDIKKEKFDALEIIELINGAGGIAVLAHPMKIKNIGTKGTEEMYDNLEKIISELSAHGLGGLECCYASNTEDETARCRSLAEKYGLISTRGSDWHGPNRKH